MDLPPGSLVRGPAILCVTVGLLKDEVMQEQSEEGGLGGLYGSHLATEQAKVWSQTWTRVRESEFQKLSKVAQVPDAIVTDGKTEAQDESETHPGPSVSW